MAKGTKTGGRTQGSQNKQAKDVRALARQYTDIAIKRLAFWAKSDEPVASVKAAGLLLDRGWGQPKQDVSVSATFTFNVVDSDTRV